MPQKIIDWNDESVRNISNLFQYIRFLERFGLYGSLDFLLLNIREDADLTLILATLRVTWQMHSRTKKLKFWRESRSRMVEICRKHGYTEEQIKEEFQGLMDL